MTCGGCNDCGTPQGCNECGKCCNRCPFVWAFDDCLLKARIDGCEVDPLDLCKWLHDHETCTEFNLVPMTGSDSYIEYRDECCINGRGECQRIYICDFLSLGELECLGNVCSDPAEPCDILVFDPCCGDPKCEACEKEACKGGKWRHYKIPNAGECEMEPDENGFYKVIIKDPCGCLRECKFKATSDVYQYTLRDSWPDDPDWPFTQAANSLGMMSGNPELIDLRLADGVPEIFGKGDLEVTVDYCFGIQNFGTGTPVFNVQSACAYLFDNEAPSMVLGVSRVKTWQGNNTLPVGSKEGHVSHKILAPRGRSVRLANYVSIRNSAAGYMPIGQHIPTLGWRLHGLTVTVRAARVHQKGMLS